MQYLFIDCEASGLFDFTRRAHEPGQPRLAQIGMVFVDETRQITAQHEFLIKPRGWEMSKEATEVCGLTTEYLEQHGGPIDEALEIYIKAVESRRVIAGFNLRNYDLKVMRGELRRSGKPDMFPETRSMCLMQASRPIVGALDKRGRIKNPRLEEACAHFGIPNPGHDALRDALAVHQIWEKVIDLMIVPEINDPYNPKPKKQAAKQRSKKEHVEIGE